MTKRMTKSKTPVNPADPFTQPSGVLVVNMYSQTSYVVTTIVAFGGDGSVVTVKLSMA